MAALNQEIKTFIVKQLAHFETQQRIVDAAKEHYGVTLTTQQVGAYNPASINGSRMSKELKALFAAERKLFRENIEEIPIANKAVRLKALQRMATKSEDNGNVVVATQIMEQAAKEVGDVYTNKNKHEHDIPHGGFLAAIMGRSIPVKK